MRSSSGASPRQRLGLVERRQAVLAAVVAERAPGRDDRLRELLVVVRPAPQPAVLVLGAEQHDVHLEVVVEDDLPAVEVDLPAAVADDAVGVQLLLEGADRVAIDVLLEAHSAWSIRLGGSAESALLVTSMPISRP